ncbi:hypothetical protein NHX12_017482, partial [Muraenolepis orangiensis]
IHNGPPHDSNYGYSHAKRMIDVQNRYPHIERNQTGQVNIIVFLLGHGPIND